MISTFPSGLYDFIKMSIWSKNTYLSPQSDRKGVCDINLQKQREQERLWERATAASEFEKLEDR